MATVILSILIYEVYINIRYRIYISSVFLLENPMAKIYIFCIKVPVYI